MAALEEAAARLANVQLTDDAAAAPPALAQPLVVLMMPRALVQGPRVALGSVLLGP